MTVTLAFGSGTPPSVIVAWIEPTGSVRGTFVVPPALTLRPEAVAVAAPSDALTE